MPAAAEPASHSVELRGLRLHYLECRDADVVPLILPYGMGG